MESSTKVTRSFDPIESMDGANRIRLSAHQTQRRKRRKKVSKKKGLEWKGVFRLSERRSSQDGQGQSTFLLCPVSYLYLSASVPNRWMG